MNEQWPEKADVLNKVLAPNIFCPKVYGVSLKPDSSVNEQWPGKADILNKVLAPDILPEGVWCKFEARQQCE